MLLDFVYPSQCLVCEKRIENVPWFCFACENKLIEAVEAHVYQSSEDFKYIDEALYFDKVVTCWSYFPEIEKLIYHVKYHQGRKLGAWLGKFAAGRIGDEVLRLREGCKDKMNHKCSGNEEGDGVEAVIMPVPLHPVRQRERGYNQASLYCRGFAERLGIPVVENVLIRNRRTQSQTTLSAEERLANVRNAFTLKTTKPIEDKCIYLVDDLITSGNTLNACAKVLKSSGAREVIGVALVRPKIHFEASEFA